MFKSDTHYLVCTQNTGELVGCPFIIREGSSMLNLSGSARYAITFCDSELRTNKSHI